MASTMCIGKISEFHPKTESVSSYIERVEFFFSVNDVPAAKHVPVLLGSIGGRCTTSYNLLVPAALKDKSFKELVTALKSHFELKPLVIAERFKFHQRGQASEYIAVAEYIAELHRLATHCEFGAYLDEALRDWFVCGLKDEVTQKVLLTETEQSFAKAVDVAQGREAAARNARQLQETLPSTQEVNKVSVGEGTNCYRCDKARHRASQCPMISAVCYNCGKRGYFRAVCRAQLQGQSTQNPNQKNRQLYLEGTRFRLWRLIRGSREPTG